MSTKKQRRRVVIGVRRIVLGVGHPWFHHYKEDVMFDAISITDGDAGPTIPLKYRGVGGWNKVRLVLEILK